MVTINISYAKSIVAIGDSLTAGYGINKDKIWIKLLAEKLKKNNYNYTVINSSISGDTTSNGLSRFNNIINKYNPEIIILGLGSNDGMRGLSISHMQSNLSKMIEMAKNKNINILLLGFKIPINYGPLYSKQFEEVFINLSKKYNISLVPFLLENIAMKKDLTIDDGIHPNEKAQSIILDNIWPSLHPLLHDHNHQLQP